MVVAVTVDDAFGRKPLHIACGNRSLVAVQMVVRAPVCVCACACARARACVDCGNCSLSPCR